MNTETNTANICNELVRYSGTVHSGASHAMRNAERALLSQERRIEALTAKRDELRARLDAATPATPAPGEWVEWHGGSVRLVTFCMRCAFAPEWFPVTSQAGGTGVTINSHGTSSPTACCELRIARMMSA